jgi:regulatory protein SWI6
LLFYSVAVSQLVEEMTVVYSQELKSKQEQLTETHAQLRDITRELAEIRRQNLLLKQQNNRLPELLHRIHNLEQYLNEELAKNPSMIQLPDPAPDTNYESKSKNELLQECLHLRQMVVSREAVESQLRNEIIQLRAESGSQELHCKKIIAACCNVPIESVQGLIGPLLNAIESDEDPMDMSQVAAFMSRVKQQESGYL